MRLNQTNIQRPIYGMILGVLLFSFSSCQGYDDQTSFDPSINKEKLDSILEELKSVGDDNRKVTSFNLKHINQQNYKDFVAISPHQRKVHQFNRPSLDLSSNQFTLIGIIDSQPTSFGSCPVNLDCVHKALQLYEKQLSHTRFLDFKITYIPSNLK
ncbi:hypothetical protein [Aquimarina brevivitae]|uniref:Uncharacterized protein n=1 Tax=Aquimarina brevivitae TaxID=323412 RepID=A0A4V2F7A4_9FLAO|nr:hypothetical protein [Aquimarina brevivitae]RZS99129.1 hypothetical protein EV197_0335 [Aquimarina brevivitae]